MNTYEIGDVIEFNYYDSDITFEKVTLRGIVLGFEFEDSSVCIGLISCPEYFLKQYAWPIDMDSFIKHTLKQPRIKLLISEYNIHSGHWFNIPTFSNIKKLQSILLFDVTNQIKEELT